MQLSAHFYPTRQIIGQIIELHIHFNSPSHVCAQMCSPITRLFTLDLLNQTPTK